MNPISQLTGLDRAVAAHEAEYAAAEAVRRPHAVPAVTTFSAYSARRAALFGKHGLELATAAHQLDIDARQASHITTLAADGIDERVPFEALVNNPKAREILGLDPRQPFRACI